MTDAQALQRLARTTGLLYVVLIVFGMFSPIVLESLVVPGDAGATASNILASLWLFRISLLGWVVIVAADVTVSVVLFLLFESFDRLLSFVSAGFRVVYSTILGAYLLQLFEGYQLLTGAPSPVELGPQASALVEFQSFTSGFRLALVFFGVHLLLLGGLLQRSKYVPGLLALLMIAAGLGYVLDGLSTFLVLGRSEIWSTVLLTPALLGEVGLTGWLIAKGVRVRGQMGG